MVAKKLGTLYTRLQLGEILVTITMTDSFTHQAKLKGAPIVHAEEVTPVTLPGIQCRRAQRVAAPQRGTSVLRFSYDFAGSGNLAEIRRPNFSLRSRHAGLQIRTRKKRDLHETRAGRDGGPSYL